MNRVCVIGSINMDMVSRVNHQPKTGETILAQSFEKIPGGKGANQSVAAKRCGADVMMIGKTGCDDNGRILKGKLEDEGINTDFVFEDSSEATGMAMITIDEDGDNSIVVVSGSNMTITEEEISKAEASLKMNDIVVAQFETSTEITAETFKTAKKSGIVTILNPAPAKDIDNELLSVTDIIVPNETEAAALTGVKVETMEDAEKAAEKFMKKGVKVVIITLGSKGAAVIGEGFSFLAKAYKVQAVDTTAAGDTFIGAFASRLDVKNINEENLKAAAEFANKASSIAVQRKGAQPSIPYLSELL